MGKNQRASVKTFHIDCEIDYEVIEQSLFVFNLGAVSLPNQRIVAESLAATSKLPIDEFRDEGGHNRFHRVDVPPVSSACAISPPWRFRRPR